MAKITFEDKNYFAGQPFNQLKDSEVNEIKTSVNALYGTDNNALGYAVVTELPATIPIGVQLLYNGTMWRGLLEGESSLAAGTPWPVKGYKEYDANIRREELVTVSEIVKINTADISISLEDAGYVLFITSCENVNYFNDFILTAMVYDVGEAIGIPCGFHREELNITLLFEQSADEIELIEISIKLYPPAPL